MFEVTICKQERRNLTIVLSIIQDLKISAFDTYRED